MTEYIKRDCPKCENIHRLIVGKNYCECPQCSYVFTFSSLGIKQIGE